MVDTVEKPNFLENDDVACVSKDSEDGKENSEGFCCVKDCGTHLIGKQLSRFREVGRRSIFCLSVEEKKFSILTKVLLSASRQQIWEIQQYVESKHSQL